MAARTVTVTKVHPITQRVDRVVMAWIFTLTMQEGTRQAMDTVTVPINPPQSRKPLADWRRAQVDALITSTLASHPKVPALHRLLDQRLEITEHMDFDIETLP